MIGSNFAYTYYLNSKSAKLDTIKSRMAKVNSTLAMTNDYFTSHKPKIEAYTNVSFDKLLLGTITIADIRFTITPDPDFKSSFITFVKLHLKALKLQDELKAQKDRIVLSQAMFSKINNLLDKYIVRSILDGGTWILDKNHGEIRIKEKQALHRENEKYNHKVVDWGESGNVKLAIAKQYLPDVYEDYVNHRISKDKFNELLKPYLFSKDNPKGHEWLVYRSDTYTYWWYWRKCKAIFHNIHLYTFVPTFYNNTVIDGVSIKPTELHNHITIDTLFDYPIGNVQRLALIRKLDPYRHLKYRHDI